MLETMRPIDDYPGYYITEEGDIYSDKYGDLRKLKPARNCRGYLNTILRKNGKSYNERVHRLVAKTYIPNPNNAPEVDHIDRDKLNNSVDNLRWVTRSENMKNRDFSNNNRSPLFIQSRRNQASKRPRRSDGTFCG